MAFRTQFNFPNISVANWFPGHMAKGLLLYAMLSCHSYALHPPVLSITHLTGMRNMAKKLQYCDCILEVHDARVSQILTMHTC